MPQFADTTLYSSEEKLLWERLRELQKHEFFTSKGLPFSFSIRGNELLISRRSKSITRATVNMAYQKAYRLMDADGCVGGPKKLGVFGASYIYPLFLELGIIRRQIPRKADMG